MFDNRRLRHCGCAAALLHELRLVGARKLVTLFSLGFVAFVVFPAFDHRVGWSPVAPLVSVVADLRSDCRSCCSFW
jgi:hypothetical protein